MLFVAAGVAAVVTGNLPFGQGPRQSTYGSVSTEQSSYTQYSTSTSESTTPYSESSTTSVQSTESSTESQSSSSVAPGLLNLVVNTTIVDRAQAVMQCGREAGCTSMIYIFNITVTNVGGQNDTFSDFGLVLQTNSSALYHTYPIVYAIQSPATGRSLFMPSPITLAPGQRASGEEGFDVPLNESPVSLQFPDYNGAEVTADVPQPTLWVSEVVTFGDVTISPPDLACGTSQGVCFTAQYTGLNESTLGSSDYYTGQKMAFEVTVFLGAGQANLGGLKIMTSVGGFTVAGYTSFDCTAGAAGSCSAWTFDVYLTAQPGVSYWGSPGLTVLLTET